MNQDGPYTTLGSWQASLAGVNDFLAADDNLYTACPPFIPQPRAEMSCPLLTDTYGDLQNRQASDIVQPCALLMSFWLLYASDTRCFMHD